MCEALCVPCRQCRNDDSSRLYPDEGTCTNERPFDYGRNVRAQGRQPAAPLSPPRPVPVGEKPAGAVLSEVEGPRASLAAKGGRHAHGGPPSRTPAALYEAFEPAQAKRIVDRLEFHYTPKHGSWLNMVEIEIGVLSEQCLDRRIPDEDTLRREIAAWEGSRNKQRATVDWRFTTSDARVRLKRLYPDTIYPPRYQNPCGG
jgi:hypothetical protein